MDTVKPQAAFWNYYSDYHLGILVYVYCMLYTDEHHTKELPEK